MKNKSLINYLCLSGIISVIFYLLHDIIGAMNYPDYNWLSQAVSDLTAVNSPSFIIANEFLTLYKIFNCLCSALLCILIKNEKIKFLKFGIDLFSIMNYISAIGFTFFPLSSDGYDGSLKSFIHVYIITISVVMLSILSLILIAAGSLKRRYNILCFLAILSLILMFAGAIISVNIPKEYFGLFERFSVYSAVIFTGILGLYGFNNF